MHNLQKLGDATVVTNNPQGQSYVGTLPEKPFWKTGSLDGNVKGSITVKSSPGGVGVDYTVKFSNLPKEGGPFRESGFKMRSLSEFY